MISTGRALEPDDDRSHQERKQEAVQFLRHQGTISVLSLLGLTLFALYPNTYIAIGVICFIYGLGRVLDRRGKKQACVAARDKAVLITGCDTGFGHTLAKQLSSLDVTVFAGCLRATGDGATALKEHNPERIHVIQMDVTRDDQIQAALEYVNKVTARHGLWGLVNNAGLTLFGDVELTTMEQFERVANINQLGMIRVTKAFLPLVRKLKGRIVNVTCAKGRVSCMFSAAYGMTKFAGETFSDILRQEMRQFGVQVIIIEPGNFIAATDCLEPKRIRQEFRDMWRHLPKEAKDTYGQEYVDHHIKEAKRCTSNMDISLVTNAMEEALFMAQPKTRYLVGGSNHWYDKLKIRAIVAAYLPEWFMDGLEIHDVRGYPTPEALIGQEDHH